MKGSATGFNTLSEQFVSSYHEYDKHFKHWAKDGNDGSPCYLMFGTSGAGKSTLMARLMSNLQPGAFIEAATTSRSDGYTYIDDVKIGHAALKSTTLIPRPYTLPTDGSMHVIDMPGFSDFDEDRRIIIGVLHKCLLTRIRSVKFIVVLGIEALASKVPGRTIIEYCEAFEQLFGERYNQYMEHVYFVLTKNDKVGLKEQDIVMAMFSMLKGAGSLNKPALSAFLTRLSTNHVVLDYTTEDANATRERIVGMVNEDARAREHTLAVDALNIKNLQAQEEQLTVRCGHEITRLLETVSAKADEVQKAATMARDEVSTLSKQAEVLTANHAKQVNEASTEYAELHKVNEALANHESKCSKLREELAKHTANVEFAKAQLGRMDAGVEDYENVNYRCDVSNPPGTFSKTHSIRTTIAMNAQMKDRHIVVVTSDEVNDASLANHIATFEKSANTRTPLLPKNLKTIEVFREGKVVLYHSTGNVNNFAQGNVKLQAQGDRMVVELQHAQPFKMFIYWAAKFRDTPAYEGLREHLDKNLIDAQQGVAKCEGALRSLEDQNRMNVLKKDNLMQSHKHRTLAMRDSVTSMVNLISYVTATAKSKEEVVENFRQASEPDSYPGLADVEEIDRIYSVNRLQTDLRGRCTSVRGRLDTIKTRVVQTRSDIDKMATAVAKSLTDSVNLRPSIPQGLLLPHFD